MVKKRGQDRIEKVVRTRTKRPLNAESESCSSSPKREKNTLNDRILSLYKNEVTPKRENSSNEELVNCDDEKNKNKNIVNKSVLENGSSSNEELHNFADKKKESQQVQTEKSKSSKSEAGSLKKKTSAFGLKHSELSFKHVGGLDKVLMDVLDIFLHTKDPKVFASLGIQPSGGFLLHGPPGCGKTHLARAIAGELNWPYIEVAATELVCGISGESEGKIREMFEEAVKNAPCILFIDEIDAISPKRETTERGMERRMVAQLLKCFDDLNEMDVSSSVVVIGATNRPDSMDPALRRGGRFDTEFAIGIPDENARLIILKVLFKNLKLAPDFDMRWLAHHTPGYVGADLKSLITKGVKVGIRRIYKKYINDYLETQKDNPRENLVQQSIEAGDELNLETESLKNIPLENLVLESNKPGDEPNLESVLSWFKSKWEIPDEELENTYFVLSDFQDALKNCIPYAKREGFAMVPDVTYEDVGALKEIIEELQQCIIWPVKFSEIYERYHMSSTKGILLYGPKGCGKTHLAKALANEGSINFLSVKGPELLSMYLGESEKAVRQCFQRARDSAPCVIFFDEIDALCPARSGSNVNAAAERVVNQLLTEMDGMEERKQVFVIAATNRLEKIDSAMLRPGRLEKIMFLDLPSEEGRYDILMKQTKNKKCPKIADDVDLKEIASDSRCENLSGADLDFLRRAAFDKAVKDYIMSSNTGKVLPGDVEVKKQHFDFAFTKVKPSISPMERKNYQDTFLRFRS